jgi:hypothetical protein
VANVTGLDHRGRYRCAGCQRPCQRRELFTLPSKSIQLCAEHRWNAKDYRAAFDINGVHDETGVELLRRKHDRAAACESVEEAHYEAEAVEQRWRAADDIFACEGHGIAEESGVVDDVSVDGIVSTFTSTPSNVPYLHM